MTPECFAVVERLFQRHPLVPQAEDAPSWEGVARHVVMFAAQVDHLNGVALDDEAILTRATTPGQIRKDLDALFVNATGLSPADSQMLDDMWRAFAELESSFTTPESIVRACLLHEPYVSEESA